MNPASAGCSPSWWLLVAASVAVASFSVRVAHARACATDADCPHGFGCEGGSTSDTLLPFPATSPGTVEGGPPGACVSLLCQSDSDCGSGTRCELDVDTLCTELPDGGTSCGPGNMCVPAWQARCTTDGDCGSGFTCSGTDGYDNLAPPSAVKVPAYATATSVPCKSLLPPVAPPPNLMAHLPDGGTCTSITWSTCVAQPTGPCTADTDCPSSWTCACPAPAASAGGAIGGGGIAAGGNLAADARAPSAVACTRACQPPDSDLRPIYPTAGGSGGELSPTGNGAPTLLLGGVDAGASPKGTPTTAPAKASTQGGCHVVAGDPAAATPWAALFGLAVAQGVRAHRAAKRRRGLSGGRDSL